ncbi:phage tail tip lysozyme [Mesorhizobium shangrilense]|uniref:Phage tail tip lysozyme n=1 Tax=Mesorhizobium shangrilense TaxID=460060 RepID=A0ABV2DFW0_9HYPH
MPTVIDSLIVTLGLDPSNFEKSQKKQTEAWLKSRDEFRKGGKDIEDSSKRAAETVNLITRRVLELFAVVTGSQALSEFVRKLTNADASLGRFASSLGESPQRLAAWENAAERFGGSADQTASTLERVNKQLYNLNKNGEALPREFSQLQAWTGMRIDPNHGLDRYLSDVAAALQRLHQIDAGAAHNVAQTLGIDPATEQLMYKMGSGIDVYLGKLEKSLSPSNAAIDAAQKLQTSWAELLQQIIELANAVYDRLAPVLIDAAARMTAWIEKNQDWIRTGIVDAVKQFIDFLSKIDWNAVGTGMQNFASGAKDVVDELGGIIKTTEILFGLWAGAKFLRVLGNMRMLAGGGAAAGAAEGAGAGLMGFFGKLSPWLAMLTLSGDTPKRGGGYNPPDFELDQITALKKWDRSGPQARNHARPAGETTVDGHPVSKSNPLPVTITDQKSDGGGFWSSLVNSVSGLFAAGERNAFGTGAAGDLPSGPQNSRGKHGWWTPERQAHAYQRLRDEAGFTDAGARAAVSRWANVEASGGPSSSNNQGGGHYGIAQWSRSRGRGVWGNPDFDAQLSLAIKEFNTNEKAAGDVLRKAATDSQAAVGMSRYERGEGYNAWNGMDSWTGKTYRGMKGISTGAKSAALSNISSTHTASTSNSSVEAHIGKVEVNTQATDANGIAADINSALSRRLFTAQANSGLA